MANYGERLVYWYLRLQGFCLLENFVLHRHDVDTNVARTSDTDLLGIRLSRSHEEIDGERLEPDPWLSDKLEFTSRHVGLIVQVKTGRRNSARKAFDRNRLLYALKFLGVPGLPAKDIVDALHTNPTALAGRYWLVGKLLVTESTGPRAESQPHLTRSMDQLLSFIEQRLSRYSDRKEADRLFFADDLMQFLAWRSSRG